VTQRRGPEGWADLVEFLQVRSKGALSQQDAAQLLEKLGERVASMVLLKGGRVVWRGLGVFYAKKQAAKWVRPGPPGSDPDAAYLVPERLLVRFRPGRHARRPLEGAR